MYDLRSDTVTKPSESMRKAMYEAEVGDDVLGDDPTVNALQDLGAEITGKEASLFVPSGTMGNLIPLYLNGGRGNEVLLHEKSHILHYELASSAAIAGVMCVPAGGDRGILKPEVLEPLIRPSIYYMTRTTMISIENTHNFAGGTCYGLEDLKALKLFADKKSLSLHLDGARLFNASAATGLSPSEISSYAHTVTFCLSKGLGAPVGSILAGHKEFINEARRLRKMLGGGMRQAGILGAAGIYALKNNVSYIEADHRNALKLAAALSETSWAKIKGGEPETNILFFETPGRRASDVAAALKERGILSVVTGAHVIRMVTSLAVSEEDISVICKKIRSPEL